MDDERGINPSTGLPMIGSSIDVSGNAYGCNSNDYNNYNNHFNHNHHDYDRSVNRSSDTMTEECNNYGDKNKIYHNPRGMIIVRTKKDLIIGIAQLLFIGFIMLILMGLSR